MVKYCWATSRRQATPLKQSLENAIAICFDNLDALKDRAVAQEEAFHLINNARNAVNNWYSPDNYRSIAYAFSKSVCRPVLAWGIAVSVEPPAPETRLNALYNYSAQSPTNRIINSYYKRLRPSPRTCTKSRPLPNVSCAVKNSVSIRQGLVDRILAVVAEHFSIRPGDIAGKRRQRHIGQARQTTLLLARRLTNYSLEALGGLVGGRDHTTILHAVRQAEERQQNDRSIEKISKPSPKRF